MAETEENVIVNGVECRTFKEMILYKMDRTFAVLGIILIGCWAMAKGSSLSAEQIQVATGSVTALATYIGSRTGK